MTVIRTHAHPSSPLEAKVVAPTLSAAALVALVQATIGVLRAAGVDVSAELDAAIGDLLLAALPFVMFIVGYRTRHTPRPDLPAHDEPAPQPLPAVDV